MHSTQGNSVTSDNSLIHIRLLFSDLLAQLAIECQKLFFSFLLLAAEIMQTSTTFSNLWPQFFLDNFWLRKSCKFLQHWRFLISVFLSIFGNFRSNVARPRCCRLRCFLSDFAVAVATPNTTGWSDLFPWLVFLNDNDANFAVAVATPNTTGWSDLFPWLVFLNDNDANFVC
jgi:hypothetical protein